MLLHSGSESISPSSFRPRCADAGIFLGKRSGEFFGLLVPYLLEPYTGSAMIFFGTIAAVVTVGACVPLLFGKETFGQLEMVTAAAHEPGKA